MVDRLVRIKERDLFLTKLISNLTKYLIHYLLKHFHVQGLRVGLLHSRLLAFLREICAAVARQPHNVRGLEDVGLLVVSNLFNAFVAIHNGHFAVREDKRYFE